MKTSEVIKQLLMQLDVNTPKDEAIKLAIISVVDNLKVKSPAAKADKEVAEAEPAGKVKRKRGRKPFDIGKAKACRDAGWSIAKIADEMSVSEQTVRNRLAEVPAAG